MARRESIRAKRIQGTLSDFVLWSVFVAALGALPLLAAVIYYVMNTHIYDSRVLSVFKEGEILAPAYAICGASLAQWLGKQDLRGWGVPIKAILVGSDFVLIMIILALVWVISLHTLGAIQFSSSEADIQQTTVDWSTKMLLVAAGWGAIGQLAYSLASR